MHVEEGSHQHAQVLVGEKLAWNLSLGLDRDLRVRAAAVEQGDTMGRETRVGGDDEGDAGESPLQHPSEALMLVGLALVVREVTLTC